MRYEVVEADFQKNGEDIVCLWKENFDDVVAPEKRIAWLSETKPDEPAKCWLLWSEKEKEFVGTATLLPRTFYVDGVRVPGGIVADTVMNKGHRTLGPALMLQRAVISEAERSKRKIVIGFPNQFSEPVNLRVGYKVIGSYVRMVKYHKCRNRLSRSFHNYAAIGISPIVDFCLNLDKYYPGNRMRWGKYSFEMMDQFDDSFDLLWEKMPKGSLVIGERTQVYLKWRYKLHPHKTFKIFCAKDDGGELAGYIIFSTENGRIEIFDIVPDDLSDALISKFICEEREGGIESVEIRILDGGDFVRTCKRFLFLKREKTQNIVYYGFGNQKNNKMGNEFRWYLMFGDTDL